MPDEMSVVDLAREAREVPDDASGPTGQSPFPPPEPLKFKREEQKSIADTVVKLFEERTRERESRTEDHLRYDQMFRGKVSEFNPRQGPWENSANLHVQMPYWLVSALEARLNHIIWSQNPLVVGHWEEPNDRHKVEVSAHHVEWNMQPRRMNMRQIWSRSSKIRLVHGHSVTLMSYADVDHIFRMGSEPDDTYRQGSTPLAGKQGFYTKKKYQGPVAYPFEWDDVVAPDGCMNYQPNGPDNPGGADYVVLRQYELLSAMVSKAQKRGNTEGQYYNMLSGEHPTKEWWMDNAPTSPPGIKGNEGDERTQQRQRMDGVNVQGHTTHGNAATNPTMEVLVYWGPWKHPRLNFETEMLFIVSRSPKNFLGGYLLSDVLYTGKRPLREMNYETVANHINSMGVCELVERLSEELDTIHNLRVDVGFATNMPWYFVRNTSGVRASQIKIAPLALIPVDDPQAVTPGGAPQNVTSFYHQEETLLLSIIERVMGVADMFLGINVTGGAAARHATGFLGTQQESEARMANPINQDAETFSFMCHLINDLELMYGPPERRFRLHGRLYTLRKPDLYFHGDHDFRLGANIGMFNQQFQAQRAQTEYSMFVQNPLVMQDMSRLWHLSAEVLRSGGRSLAEIEEFLGPVAALPTGDPKTPDEAMKEVVEGTHGEGGFPAIHPSDDNAKFVESITELLESPVFIAMGRPNEQGLLNYMQAQQQAHMAKMQQQMMAQQAAMAQQGGPQQGGPPQGGGASPMNRAMAQIGGGGATTQDTYAAQTAAPTGTIPPPPTNGR